MVRLDGKLGLNPLRWRRGGAAGCAELSVSARGSARRRGSGPTSPLHLYRVTTSLASTTSSGRERLELAETTVLRPATPSQGEGDLDWRQRVHDFIHFIHFTPVSLFIEKGQKFNVSTSAVNRRTAKSHIFIAVFSEGVNYFPN